MDLEPSNDDGTAAARVGDRTETIVPRPGSSDSDHPVTPRTPSAPGHLAAEASEPLIDGDPDRYSSQGEHARGGLGRVLRARDHRLGRTVAIKELLHTSASAEARFVREALITARLQHPSIVPVHEAGRWPNGDPYYVMKLISGRSLKELLRDRPAMSDRVALLPNVIAVAEAIAYAHSEGVIHRDIKPANVMIGEFGETVVVDWGIAKDRRVNEPLGDDAGADADDARAPSATAGVLGTPAYMSPEQASGAEVDERSDVYALGALLYEVLAGAQPYARTGRMDPDDGDSPASGDVLARVLAGPPRPLDELDASVPPELLAVVNKAMERDRDARYGSAKAFAEDLKRYQTGKLVTAHQYSKSTLVKRWMWRNRALVIVAALALAMVAALGVLAFTRVIDERNAARAERTQAEHATRSTEKRRLQLLMLQAKSSLDRDPTAAVAWLKTYPETGPAYPQVLAMIDDAEARGVARHVFRLDGWGYAVAFAPRRPWLAAVGQDHKVRLFDVRDGSSVVLATAHAPLHAVAFAPDGRALAVGTESGEVAVMPLPATGNALPPPAELPVFHRGHDGGVLALAFSPDGQRLVSIAGSVFTHFRIWDAGTLEILDGRTGRTNVSDDGRFVATVDLESRVPTIIDVQTGKQVVGPALDGDCERVAVGDGGDLASAVVVTMDSKGVVRVLDRGPKPAWRHIGTHAGKVDNLQISPAGTYAATVSYDRTIRLMKIAPGPTREPHVKVLTGHEDAIYRVAFSADEKRMVSAGDDATARVWDLESGESRVLRGHEDDVYSVALSPTGDFVASISLDSTVRVWPAAVESSRVFTRGTEPVSSVEFASNDELVTQSYEGGILLWSLASGESRRLAKEGDPKWMRRRLELTSDRRRGATIVGKGEVYVWDLEAGETFQLVSEFGKASSVHFSPDGRRAVVAYPSGVVAEWDLETRTPSVLAKGDSPVAAIYSPEGNEVAVARAGGVTRWDLKAQKVAGEHTILAGADKASPDVVLYSGDGRWLAMVSRHGSVTLFDRRSNQSRALHIGEDKFTGVEFSPNGTWLAAGGTDRQIRVWNTETGALRILGSHTDMVMRVVFSPDSNTLASSSYDKTLRLWQLDSGKTRILRGHSASVDTVAFSPDGRVMASGSRDGAVRLWAVGDVFSGGTPEVISARMDALTTAVITATDRPETVN